MSRAGAQNTQGGGTEDAQSRVGDNDSTTSCLRSFHIHIIYMFIYIPYIGASSQNSVVAIVVNWASEATPGSRAEPRITNLVNSSGLPIILRRLLGRGPRKLGSGMSGFPA